MKLFCAVILLFCSYMVKAQSNVLVLKEKGRNIQSWVKGDAILFQFSNTQWLSGKIKAISNDSILLNQFVTRQVPNQFGFPTVDTFWVGVLQLHINEIIGMPGNRFKSGIFSNGALLQLGSGAYIFLNLFNSLYRKEPVFGAANITRLGIAAGVFLVGKIQQRKHRDYLLLGKKYTLTIISSATAK